LCVAAVALLLAWPGSAALAQQLATVHGQVRDIEGKPLTVATVVIKNLDQGQTYQVKTDSKGNYAQTGLRGGVYQIDFIGKDKDQKDQVVYTVKIRIANGENHTEDFNFKEIKAQATAAKAEAQKKQEEEGKKFANMKEKFDAGVVDLDQAKQLRTQVQHAPADQRASLQDQLTQLTDKAATEFQAAAEGISETDMNRHIVMAKLGETYEIAGKYAEAVDAYQKAIALKPEEASYYNNLGNVLAKLGKIPEATAAYQKSVTLDPANAANAWRNLGIVLFQTNQYKDASDAIRKSLQLDPKSAAAWYVLGASLVGQIEFKQEGDKQMPVLPPGTVEAYQKCVELDPNGGYGAQCKEGLEQLKALGVGIETKVRNRPAKKGQP